MKKKKKIGMGIVALVVLALAIITSLPAGRNMFASVINGNLVSVGKKVCLNPNSLFACANCATVPDVIIACSLGLDTCPNACQNTTATGIVCPTGCEKAVCNDPGVVFACQINPNGALCPVACRLTSPTGCSDSDGGINVYTIGVTQGLDAITHQFNQNHDYCLPGLNNLLVEYFCSYNYVNYQIIDCINGCRAGMCNKGGTGYGYGYGYGRGGQGTGYGYGYGYGKLDPTTKKPYLYLINVFKKYSKEIYNTAVQKLGGFKMVNFYNKKEFTPAQSIPTKK